MATLDRHGRTVEVNEPMTRLLGRSREELLGRPVPDVVPMGSIGQDRAAYQRLLAGEPIVRYHRTIRLASGEEWSGEVSMSLARDADEEPELIHVRLFEDGGRRPPPRIADREGDVGLTLDEIRVGIGILGLDGRLLRANGALCAITGRTEAELQAMDLLSLSHPDDRDLDIELGVRAWMGELDSYTLEKRILRPDESIVWVRQEVIHARDAEGNLLHLIVQVMDISDRKAVEIELAHSRQQLADLVHDMPVGLLVADGRGRIVTANPEAARIAGLDEIPIGFLVTDVVHPPDVAALNAAVLAHVKSGLDYHVEFRIVRPDGSLRWIRNDARPELDEEGRLLRISGTWLDVTELKAVEDEMRRHASHDELTGLVNRRIVFDILSEGIGRCSRSPGGARLTVLFVDLDAFKAVNDTHGHGVGDDLLVEVAARLVIAVGGSGAIGRFGGDEFVVCLESGPEMADDEHDRHADETAQRIVEAMSRPFTVREEELQIGASVGVATWRKGQTADDLISASDLGVYAAKRSGRNRWSRV
jgi:diguanylate cyclase (GGDEF)-like protein/PAS domain S-box-containing protein